MDRPLCFQPANQFVVVDDRVDVGIVDVGRQFCRVVGVHNNNRLVVGHIRDYFRLIKVPALQHKERLGVRFAQKYGLCFDTLYGVQIPRPDDRAAGAVGVWGSMAKNEGRHIALLLKIRSICAPYSRIAFRVTCP